MQGTQIRFVMKAPTIKGKILQAEWPAIVRRYDQGESMASISRSYHCTAAAIRYIVKRVRGALERRPKGGTKARVRRETAGLAPIGGSGGYSAPSLGSDSFVAGDDRVPLSSGSRAGSDIFDHELWDSVSSDIAAFLVAFDAAAVELNSSRIDALIRATDRLVRAGARTRMELERLRVSPIAASRIEDPARRAQRVKA
jgi:hypothetical protein